MIQSRRCTRPATLSSTCRESIDSDMDKISVTYSPSMLTATPPQTHQLSSLEKVVCLVIVKEEEFVRVIKQYLSTNCSLCQSMLSQITTPSVHNLSRRRKKREGIRKIDRYRGSAIAFPDSHPAGLQYWRYYPLLVDVDRCISGRPLPRQYQGCTMSAFPS